MRVPMQRAGPKARDSAFPSSSQMFSVLLVGGPHWESRAKFRISLLIYSWVGDTRALLYGDRAKERNVLLSCQESHGGSGGVLEVSGRSLGNVE